MKRLPAALVVLALLARPSRAGVTVGLIAQVSQYADKPYSNTGALLELSVARASTQYFTELAVMHTSFEAPIEDGITLRAAVGIRYSARTFPLPEGKNVSLGFEALAGIHDLHWKDGRYAVRPELAAGFVWLFPVPRKLRFRASVRAFTMAAPTSTVACRGECPGTHRITRGLMYVLGFSW